jgi:hypothetical protein
MAGEVAEEEGDVSQNRGSASGASGWMNEGSVEQMPVVGLHERVKGVLWFEIWIERAACSGCRWPEQGLE